MPLSAPLAHCGPRPPRPGPSRREALRALLGLALGPATCLAAQSGGFADRAEARDWLARLAAERDLPLDWLRAALARARHDPTSARLMSRPARTASASPDDWPAHRARLISQRGVEAGRRFWRRHGTTLRAIESRWGVPAAILVALTGVETGYGQRSGDIRVLDALATLSFDSPRRAEYFRGELASFLWLCRRDGVDPTRPRGSFAGAMGPCQFMPSSVERRGVDFDGDGRVDVIGSLGDALASAANYLSAAGWRAGLATDWPCVAPAAAIARWDHGALRPDTTVGALREAGVRMKLPPGTAADTPALLVGLPEGAGRRSHRVGTVNYAALLSYNRSYFYAQSVCDLARALS